MLDFAQATGPDFARISNQILRCARARIDKFEIELLKVLQSELNLIACSLYSLNPFSGSLSLRGQSGLSYDDYESFSLSIESTAGKAFLSSRAQVFSNLIDRDDYRDKALVQKFGLGEMIVVPIRCHLEGSSTNQATVCSLCLYPKSGSDLANVLLGSGLIDQLQLIVEMSLQFSLDFTCHLLRHDIVSEALHVSSGASFLHKMLQLLKQWNFEAGSVFLFDPRAICLRLAASTGLDVRNTPRRNIFYRLTETAHQTVKAFITQKETLISHGDVHREPPKYREKLESQFHSALVCPFFAPKQTGAPQKLMFDGCLGVIRLVNRQIIHNKIEIADFTWEDRELVRFLCDILGVVTHLYQRVAQKGTDFERIVHGLETSILTVIGGLHNIEQYVDYENTFPAELKHSIPNAIAFTESMHEQIRVFKLRDVEAIEVGRARPLKLYGDVISKLRAFARNSANFHGVDKISLNLDSFHERLSPESSFTDRRVRDVPWVLADPELLLSVFKNLIENAVKYCKNNSRCSIKLDWKIDGDFVDVSVHDAGIGVPLEDEEFIFNEAYQAENAMRRRTVGTGIGLYQCRVMMEKLRGSVSYRREIDNTEGFVTTFIVRIPRSVIPT